MAKEIETISYKELDMNITEDEFSVTQIRKIKRCVEKPNSPQCGLEYSMHGDCYQLVFSIECDEEEVKMFAFKIEKKAKQLLKLRADLDIVRC